MGDPTKRRKRCITYLNEHGTNPVVKVAVGKDGVTRTARQRIPKIKHKDTEALYDFGKLIPQYRKFIYRLFNKMCIPRDEQPDLEQDIWFHIYRNRTVYAVQRDLKLMTWIAICAKNMTINHLRAKGRISKELPNHLRIPLEQTVINPDEYEISDRGGIHDGNPIRPWLRPEPMDTTIAVLGHGSQPISGDEGVAAYDLYTAIRGRLTKVERRVLRCMAAPSDELIEAALQSRRDEAKKGPQRSPIRIKNIDIAEYLNISISKVVYSRQVIETATKRILQEEKEREELDG